MSDITFSCPSCGEVLEATDEIIGSLVECPTCGKEFTVPSGDEEVSQTTNAMAEADGSPAGDAGCPNCSKPLAPDAVLCLQCGYHQGLGKVIETNFG